MSRPSVESVKMMSLAFSTKLRYRSPETFNTCSASPILASEWAQQTNPVTPPLALR